MAGRAGREGCDSLRVRAGAADRLAGSLEAVPAFLAGGCTTRFIDEKPELFHLPTRQDRASKLLHYIAEVIVNGHPLIPEKPRGLPREPAPVPALPPRWQAPGAAAPPPGTRDRFHELGPEGFSRWIFSKTDVSYM